MLEYKQIYKTIDGEPHYVHDQVFRADKLIGVIITRVYLNDYSSKIWFIQAYNVNVTGDEYWEIQNRIKVMELERFSKLDHNRPEIPLTTQNDGADVEKKITHEPEIVNGIR